MSADYSEIQESGYEDRELSVRVLYHMLWHIAKLVSEGFFYDGGRIRGIPVTIGGSRYVPPIPIESVVKEKIDRIRLQNMDAVDIAIELCLYCMKTQIFTDGIGGFMKEKCWKNF